jgi:hypothetical protein
MSDEIRKLKLELIQGMVDYMEYGGAASKTDPDYDPDFDPGYAQAQVDQCSAILDTYLDAVAQAPENNKNQAILEAVKTAVLDLNRLNEACEGSIIETDQREQLCEIIILAAGNAGLVSNEYDITEEWREW